MPDKTETPTPRTNAYYEVFDQWMKYARDNPLMPPEVAEQCPIECDEREFARQLERELNQAEAALKAEQERTERRKAILACDSRADGGMR